jgi:hypothetical protein
MISIVIHSTNSARSGLDGSDRILFACSKKGRLFRCRGGSRTTTSRCLGRSNFVGECGDNLSRARTHERTLWMRGEVMMNVVEEESLQRSYLTIPRIEYEEHDTSSNNTFQLAGILPLES